MSATLVQELADQAQEFWSPMFKDELLETNLLASLVNKEFEGDMKAEGDTVYVSQITRPTAERKTVGAGSDTFSSQKLTTDRVAIVADQRVTASFELEDLVMLQTQLGGQDSGMRRALIEAANIELNNYLYSLVAPSASAPDHTVTGVTDLNASQVVSLRQLAGAAKWPKSDPWYILADSHYYACLLNDSTLTSADFGAEDRPVINGNIGLKRYNFNIFEDNSDGLLQLSGSSQDAAIAFHPDFMYLVMQREPTFKLSDLHSNKQHGFLLSVDMVFGAVIGLEGAVKHISVIDS